MKKKNFFRFNLVYLFFILLFFVLLFKIAHLQFAQQEFFTGLAKRQHYGLFQIRAKRGKLLDRNGHVLAKSLNFYSVFADPFLIEDKAAYAQILSEKLDVSEEPLLERLSHPGRRFVWVVRKIDWRKKKEIESLNLAGIGFLREDQRFYPERELFSSVLGIVDIDNNGLEGIELYYDQYLRGKEGWVRAVRDASAQRLVLTPSLVKLQQGADLALSLDARIQYWSKKYLREQVEEFQAKKGSVVVMDAESGEIIALINYAQEQDQSVRFKKNDAIVEVFEPGSVFKIITLVAAIAEGLTFESIYCEEGAFRIPGTTLRDWRPYGHLSFEEVFYKSSNIGTAKIAEAVGHQKMYDYIRSFGFGARTGVDFPGEVPGLLRPVQEWSRTSRYIIPIGQEIGVNLLQLAQATAVIVNGGKLVTPHLVRSACQQGACKDFIFPKKNILSEKTAYRAKEVLIEIVEQGTGVQAQVKGQVVGGKTGTAQKFDVELGRYSPDKYRANFIGFISDIERPMVIAVTIDEPKVSSFGGVVAAPLFRKIAEKIAAYDLK